MRTLLETRAGRAVGAILVAIALLTLVGIVLLWPSGENSSVEVAGIAGDSLAAEVVRAERVPCPGGGAEECVQIGVELDDPPPGVPASGTIDLGSAEFNPDISVGDGVRVSAEAPPPGGEASFGLVDFERRGPLLWLALAFAALVVVFGRLRGGLSLVGLLASLAIVMVFIVPAIRDGSEPVLVAVVGALGVMLVTISLAHGLGGKSAAAMLGTSASLSLVALLALLFTELAHVTGFSSEEATLLASDSAISVQGLLLAGMVIGALGVLDDVTVSQASTVMALRSANPGLSVGELYRRAIDVGRDHITATVNTLVLAYVGASLPVLLIFSAGDVGFLEAINAEVVAGEVVAMLVGSIGLIAAVPITTGLAALLAARLPERVVAAEAEHGHAH
jgi:uncharacterized membrane protein